MFIDRSRRPEDIPAPPTPDYVAERFAGPLLTLAPQPSVEEAFIGVNAQTHNGLMVMEAATVSYTLWRNAADHDDPANIDMSDELRAQLEIEPVAPLPAWMIEMRNRMRYPWLWDAVRTTRIDSPNEVAWHTLDHALVMHTNYILQNTFRDERTDGGMPPVIHGEATARAIQRDIPVMIDGTAVSGAQIDTDAHVYAVAVELGDRILSAVFPRRHLPLFDLAFVTRP